LSWLFGFTDIKELPATGGPAGRNGLNAFLLGEARGKSYKPLSIVARGRQAPRRDCFTTRLFFIKTKKTAAMRSDRFHG
jgi:hypothetical protein